MEPLLALVAVVAAVAVLAALAWRFVEIVTVRDYERGLRFRRGRLVGLVRSGVHAVIGPFTEIHVLDGRPTTLVVEGQEVMAADGVPLKVSLAARYVVADPVAAVTGDTDFRRTIYLILQLALRDVLARRTLDEALGTRHELGPAIREASASELGRLGIELLAVDVRDLMVPGELKRAFAGVTAARKEGEAALERGRAETAALRNLANAGRLLEDNPSLLQLRMLQEIGASGGSPVTLSMPDARTSAAATRVRGGRPADAAAPTASGTPPPGEPTDGDSPRSPRTRSGRPADGPSTGALPPDPASGAATRATSTASARSPRPAPSRRPTPPTEPGPAAGS